MPVGHAGIALPLVEFVQRTQPKSVLDLGIGYGMTGAILRNYFGAHPSTGAIWPLHTGNGFRIHGVEVFPAYRNPLWDLYNEVVIGRIEDWLHLCQMVDLVVCNDVFEHLPKAIGREILKRSPKAFVGVCQVMGQDTVYGNPHEAHTTAWTQDELREFCDETFELNPGYIVGMNTGALKKQETTFWQPRDVEDAKRLIGPSGWGKSTQEYVAELFDSACVAYLQRFMERRPDMLEIGCGMGRIVKGLAPLCDEIYGIDISDGMLDLARGYLRGVDGVVLGKIVDKRFPLDDQSVDLVFATIVFQHIQERDTILKYLRESLRVLRPGGMIRVQTHRGTPPPAGTFGGFHGHFYPNVDAFAAEFAFAGFQVVNKQVGVGHSEWLWVTAKKPEGA